MAVIGRIALLHDFPLRQWRPALHVPCLAISEGSGSGAQMQTRQSGASRKESSAMSSYTNVQASAKANELIALARKYIAHAGVRQAIEVAETCLRLGMPFAARAHAMTACELTVQS
jgi:hypothetical protein